MGYWDDIEKSAGGPTPGQGADYWADIGDSAPAGGRSALGGALKSGLHAAKGILGEAVATSLTSPVPGLVFAPSQAGMALATTGKLPTLVTPKSELLEIYKNDPTAFAEKWNSPAYGAHRYSEEQARLAGRTMEELSPEAKQLLEKEYLTLDPSKSALLSPTRLLMDVLQSAPSTIATAGAIALTRSPTSGMLAGGLAEGGVEGISQRAQVRDALMNTTLDKWSNVPEFKALVANGWHPEMARQRLIEELSTEAGMKSAAFAAVAGAIGGGVLGRFVERGGGLGKRILVGGATELPTEAAQSAEQRVGENVAFRASVEPGRDFWEGVGEAAAQGGTVGALSGSLTNAAIGRRVRQDQDLSEHAANPPVPPAGGKPPTATDSTEKAELKAKIAAAAEAAGVPPEVALVVAQIESGLNPNVRSPMMERVQSAGLYQFLPITMKQFGVTRDQLLNDPDLQISTGIKLLKQNVDMLTRVLGRAPQAHEVYMAQLFGPGGVRAVLGADSDARILDIVSGYDPQNAANVVAWNGMQPTWTRDEVVAHFRRVVQRHMAAIRGGLPASTEEAAASAARRLSDLDVADEALDEILKRPKPTAAERQAGEDALRAQSPTADPDTEAALQRMEGRVDATEATAEGVDRALASRREATYDMDWVKDNFTKADGKLNADAARQQLVDDVHEALTRGDRVRIRMGNQNITLANGAPPKQTLNNILFPRPGEPWSVQIEPQTRADVGVSPDELATRQNTANRNDRTAWRSLPVVGAGTTIGSHTMVPGQVDIAAHPTEAYPQAYMQGIRQMVQSYTSRFAPGARVLLTAKTLPDEAAGTYRALGKGFYQINPRNLTRSEQHGEYRYNETTKLKALYGATHEVGHLVIDHEFFADLSASVEKAVNAVTGQQLVPEATIAEVATQSPEKAAILREYNAVKTRLLAPGMTARDFIDGWLSPWKVAHGIGQGDIGRGWLRFAKKYITSESQAAKLTAQQAALELDRTAGILGFHEYAAEQFARYAYSKKLVEQTEIGRSNFFKRTLAKLRDLFVQAKKDKLIRAGTEFERWLNQLAARTQRPTGPTLAVPEARGAFRLDPDRGLTSPDDAIVQETRAIIDARFPNLPQETRTEVDALLANGQVEQARELAEADAGRPAIVRWDRDSPLYSRIEDFMQGADKLPPVRGAARTWFSTAYRRLVDFGLYFTDLRQAAASDPFNIGLGTINRLLTEYKERLGRLEQRPVEIAQRWAKLRKQQDKALQQLMQTEWRSGQHLPELALVDGRWSFSANERFAQATRAAGLDEQTAALFLDVKNEYMYRLNRLHNVLRTQLQRKIDDALVNGEERQVAYYTGRMFDLAEAFARIRQQPYLPQTRFGNYVLEVLQRDKGEWKTTHVEAFESPEARAEARAKLHRSVSGLRMVERMHDSTSAILRVLPLDVLDDVGGAFGLTDRQMQNLRGSLDLLTTSPTTRKYSPELAAIAGRSRDQMRVFADFMHNDALVTNKLLFRSEFKGALARMEEDMAFANAAGDSGRVAQLEQTYRFAKGFVKQILNPAQEWHALRAAVVFAQLGFNIKSAVMNLTSLMQTWAAVTTRLGLGGNIEFGKGLAKVASDSFVKSIQAVTRGPKEGWEAVYTPDERWALRKGYESGMIVESFAASLASMSHEGVLERMSLPRWQKGFDKVVQMSTKPLRMVEEYTRRVTLLTTFNTARKQGLDRDTAFERAVEDTLLLQGDNSIANRAPILRGKKSAFLLYYNYMRGMTWLMSGGYERARHRAEQAGQPTARGFLQGTRARWLGGETARLWLAYLVLGGLMGEPFAEDLDKLGELLGRQLFGERFSVKEHAYEFAGWLSQNAAEIGISVSPRSIVHGMASDFFGVDVSGSVSVGNAIPGLGGIDRLDDKRGQVKALTGLLGPLGERVQAGLDLFNAGLPWERQFAFFVPKSLQNLVRGMEDEPRYYSGGKVLVNPRTGEVTSLSGGEMAAQMMGFTPAAVRANQEVHWMQQEFRSYWVERRNGLLRKAFEAQLQGDADAKYDVQRAIAEYNSEAPGGMKLTAESIRRSMTNRLKAASRDERGVPTERGLKPDFDRVRQLVLGQR